MGKVRFREAKYLFKFQVSLKLACTRDETKPKVSVFLFQPLSSTKCYLQVTCSETQMELRNKYDYSCYWRRILWNFQNKR